MYGIYLAVRILDEILFEVDKSEIVLLAWIIFYGSEILIIFCGYN